jgi:hypothetical protein
MKIRYDELSILISIIITDREHIYRWGRTHRSHERFSRRKWGPSWRYRRSVGCITATNDRLPEKPESARLRAASPRGFEISVRTVLTCTRVHRRISFARLRQGRDLLTLFASPRGMAAEAGRTEFSLGTINQGRQLFDPRGPLEGITFPMNCRGKIIPFPSDISRFSRD